MENKKGNLFNETEKTCDSREPSFFVEDNNQSDHTTSERATDMEAPQPKKEEKPWEAVEVTEEGPTTYYETSAQDGHSTEPQGFYEEKECSVVQNHGTGMGSGGGGFDGSGYQKAEKQRGLKAPAIIALCLVAAIMGGMFSSYATANWFSSDGVAESTPRDVIVIPEQEVMEQAEAVAENVMPSVVGIQTRVVTQNMFFGDQVLEGIGSGVIVHKDGYIVTNHHVIADSDNITVSLEDGREAQATVIWSEETMDLAIIKIELDNLTVATMGDSDEVRNGQTAIAIGNPMSLSFSRTTTKGIISGLDRSMTITSTGAAPITMENLIQTDAAINSGNSGGPLLNIEGEIIGITTLKKSDAESMGFAVPINVIKPILETILETGTYEPPYLGVTVIDSDLNDHYGLGIDLDNGVYIQEVTPNSSAAVAGMLAGDIVTKIGDMDVASRNSLRTALYHYDNGESTTVEIIRDGEEMTLNITFQSMTVAEQQ